MELITIYNGNLKKLKMSNTKIAVYGTLREGFGNHRVLGDSKLIGKGFTNEKFKLTASGIPFVTKNEKISRIKVEVYDVSPSQLPIVDGLEGYNPNNHDGSWYKRESVDITLEDGSKIDAQIYFGDSDASTVIESGDYADYTRN